LKILCELRICLAIQAACSRPNRDYHRSVFRAQIFSYSMELLSAFKQKNALRLVHPPFFEPREGLVFCRDPVHDRGFQ